MRALELTCRVLLTVVRLAIGVTIAVARMLTVCMLWLLAPRACLAFTMLRRR